MDRLVRLIPRWAAFAFFLGLLAPANSVAQRYKLVSNPDSPEGAMLDLIELTSDENKKLSLLEEFAQKHPKHASASWVNEQLQTAYITASQWDKALAAGERLLAQNPDDLEAAQFNLKAAEAKNDKVLVKLWTDFLTRVAERITTAPPPKDPEVMEAWKNRVMAAAQYTSQEEYAMLKRALDATDPKARIKHLDELCKQYPSTQYMAQALLLYFQTYQVLGDSMKMMHYAEQVLQKDPKNQDALLVVAQNAGGDKALTYGARIIELMQSKPKPQGVSDEEWTRKKNYYTGTAYWMMGNAHINGNRFGQADQALRAALGYLRRNEQAAPAILFYLGWANYKLDNFAEAARFYTECLAYRGRFQEQAAKNIDVLRREHPPD
ncbi:MAG: hypothetical protein HY013_06105 [Candidatus Solibacter usitatus]|nr:hypothetical protein [Candidatus Solibacter usitatus]